MSYKFRKFKDVPFRAIVRSIRREPTLKKKKEKESSDACRVQLLDFFREFFAIPRGEQMRPREETRDSSRVPPPFRSFHAQPDRRLPIRQQIAAPSTFHPADHFSIIFTFDLVLLDSNIDRSPPYFKRSQDYTNLNCSPKILKILKKYPCLKFHDCFSGMESKRDFIYEVSIPKEEIPSVWLCEKVEREEEKERDHFGVIRGCNN